MGSQAQSQRQRQRLRYLGNSLVIVFHKLVMEAELRSASQHYIQHLKYAAAVRALLYMS